MISRKAKFIEGAKKGIPITFGYIPMGIGYAAIAIKAGMSPLETVAMSVFVYAGAGQFIAASMVLSSASIMAIVLTNFVVNLRYFVMSTCVLNQVEDSNLPLNILAAHTTVDESFAMFSLSQDSSIWVYLGIAIIAWLSWIFGAAIGVVVLDLLPVIVTNSFNISLYALFVAILVPAVKENRQVAALVVITAVLNIILSQFLGNWALIVSTLVGAAVGMYIVDDEYVLSGDA
ncbi:AzlC family ABC transporter permease [Methanobrevibacter sp.]|uniref:AzlC family ABC transporter permease n=1 Tax=Methanobrevibacter sp. TaxID=66852 RepID=UPI002A7490A6|nr:AzlC family ABC transporter permease [Methanobrevibacter sp.]MDY3096671.1 AzlC family ABC transporter permease [Methanobrevibacter sp.]